MSEMKGLTALVTGGGSGIGFATSKLLLDAGANVMIIGRDSSKLKNAVESLGAPETQLRFSSGNISSEGYANKLVRDTISAFGALDIVINNAGVFRMGTLFEMSEEDFDYNVDVNLKGTWMMCKFAARNMRERGGSIVNVSSFLALRGFPKFPSSAYAASKGGILSLSRALAVELAPYKIRVNTVVPAVINTPMLESVMGHEKVPKMLENAKKLHPLGRAGEPADVARAIFFLANPANEWITGAEIAVDGGRSAT